MSVKKKESSGSSSGGLISGLKSLLPLEYQQHKYFLEEDIIYIGKDNKKTFINKELIKEIIIERDFEYDVMPFLLVKGSVQDLTAVRIAMGLPEGTMHVKVSKAIPNFNNKNISTYKSGAPADKQFINKKMYIDESFQIFMDNQSIKMYEKFAGRRTDTSAPSDALSKKSEHDNEEPLEVALIKKDHIMSPKKIINCVIPAGATIADMVGFGLSQAGISNILMSKPDNSTGNTKAILVPPMNILDYFDFINQTRGIYNTKYRFFQDFKRTYFLDSGGKCNAFEKKEIKKVNIFINSHGQEGSKTYGSLPINKSTNTGESTSEGEEVAISVPDTGIKISTNSAFNKEIKFSSILSANFRGSDTESSSIDGVSGYDNTIVKTNVYSNPFILKSEAHAASESNCVIRMNLMDIDADIFTPNKQYVVKFGNPSYDDLSGDYRLVKLSTVLQRASDEFTMFAIAEFRKVPVTAGK
ncbi:MAG: hypothetical protein ACRCXX_05825 [Cetobacterium sp.]|uniref:hypothetical protein n=1 Tax=Cetobacterium sp. TaxID=2071632 RepID=UPI003F2B5B12